MDLKMIVIWVRKFYILKLIDLGHKYDSDKLEQTPFKASCFYIDTIWVSNLLFK